MPNVLTLSIYVNIWVITLKYNCQMLSPIMNDNSHTGGLVGLYSCLYILLIADISKINVLNGFLLLLNN